MTKTQNQGMNDGTGKRKLLCLLVKNSPKRGRNRVSNYLGSVHRTKFRFQGLSPYQKTSFFQVLPQYPVDRICEKSS